MQVANRKNNVENKEEKSPEKNKEKDVESNEENNEVRLCAEIENTFLRIPKRSIFSPHNNRFPVTKHTHRIQIISVFAPQCL